MSPQHSQSNHAGDSKKGSSHTTAAKSQAPKRRHDWHSNKHDSSISHAQTKALIARIDCVGELRGIGVIISDPGYVGFVRPPKGGLDNVLCVRINIGPIPPAPRMNTAALHKELTELGYNAAGLLALCVGAIAAAPTGPLGEAWLGVQATAATHQAVHYFIRVHRELTRHHELNEAEDNYWKQRWITPNRVEEGIGLAAAGQGMVKDGASLLKAAKEVHLSQIGFTGLVLDIFKKAPRSQRIKVGHALELSRVTHSYAPSAQTLNSELMMKTLSVVSGGFSGYVSTQSGMVHDAEVWLIGHRNHSHQDDYFGRETVGHNL